MRRMRLGTLVLMGVATWSAGCRTVDETGRKQLMLVTSAQEQRLGAQAYEEILAAEQRGDDKKITAIVVRVGQRIAAVADRPDFDWEFALIESPQANAFCLPGGKIAIYTGILPVLENEAAMAAVMGHEVAHATLRHGGERMSQQLSVQMIGELLDYGMKDSTASTRTAAMKAFGVGSSVGVLLPFSRKHESEADEIGLMYAARAGYDPREAVRLWERMAEASQGKPPEFLSTHPHEATRIAQLEALMPQAIELYQAATAQYGLGERWGGGPIR